MDQSSNGDDSSHKLDANVTEKSKTLFETNRRASFDNESIQIGGRSKTDGQYEEIKSDKRLELLENIYNNQKEQSNQMEHAMMKEFIGILKNKCTDEIIQFSNNLQLKMSEELIKDKPIYRFLSEIFNLEEQDRIRIESCFRNSYELPTIKNKNLVAKSPENNDNDEIQNEELRDMAFQRAIEGRYIEALNEILIAKGHEIEATKNDILRILMVDIDLGFKLIKYEAKIKRDQNSNIATAIDYFRIKDINNEPGVNLNIDDCKIILADIIDILLDNKELKASFENHLKFEENIETVIGVLILKNRFNDIFKYLLKYKSINSNIIKQYDTYLKFSIENDSFDAVYLLK